MRACPYGWLLSACCEPTREAPSTSTSLIRSDSECTPSATSAWELPSQPTSTFATISATLIMAPTSVTRRLMLQSDSVLLRPADGFPRDEPMPCFLGTAAGMIPAGGGGRPHTVHAGGIR